MHCPEETDGDIRGRVGLVATTKRTTKTEAAMMQMMVEMQIANTKLMERVIAMAEQQSQMMSSWFDMWKPQAQRAPTSTSMDERMMKKELDAAAEWEPVQGPSMQMILDEFKDLDFVN
jgi:hypothetical protein